MNVAYRARLRDARRANSSRATTRTARQPIIVMAKNPSDTSTNATALPCPTTSRRICPIATVAIQTTTPVGHSALGLVQPRTAAQPTAAPTKNGPAVLAIPAMESPWACTERPTATKMIIDARSARAAINLFTLAIYSALRESATVPEGQKYPIATISPTEPVHMSPSASRIARWLDSLICLEVKPPGYLTVKSPRCDPKDVAEPRLLIGATCTPVACKGLRFAPKLALNRGQRGTRAINYLFTRGPKRARLASVLRGAP